MRNIDDVNYHDVGRECIKFCHPEKALAVTPVPPFMSGVDVALWQEDLCALSPLHSVDNLLNGILGLLGEVTPLSVISFDIFMLRHGEYLKYYLRIFVSLPTMVK